MYLNNIIIFDITIDHVVKVVYNDKWITKILPVI